MITDSELRTLFEQESKDHLDALESGILALEKAPRQPELHETVMREAHSLKGAARMLGLADIEHLSHRLESLFRHQIDSQAAYDPALTPQLFGAIDALKKLCKSAVDDSPVTVDLASLMDDLSEQAPSGDSFGQQNDAHDAIHPSTVTQQETAVNQSEFSSSSVAQKGEPSSSSQERYRIATLRVDPEKLDFLMDQVGELTVVQKRIHQFGHQLSRLNGQLLMTTESVKHLNGLANQPFSEEQQGKLTRGLAKLEQRINGLQHSINQTTIDQMGDTKRLEGVVSRIESKLQEVRMLPLSVLFNQFHRMVYDIASETHKEVELLISGEEIKVDKKVIEEMKDVIMHLLRNALTHGIETIEERKALGKVLPAPLVLSAKHSLSQVVISVTDDGRGLDRNTIINKASEMGVASKQSLLGLPPKEIDQLIFKSGLTTQEIITDVSGRGVGMDVVRNNVDHVKGTVDILSKPGKGTQIDLHLPLGFATSKLIMVKAGLATVGVPLESVETLQMLQPSDVYDLNGMPTYSVDGDPISLALFTHLLRLNQNSDLPDNSDMPCITLIYEGLRLGLIVEEVLGEQEVIIKSLSPIIGGIQQIDGVGILSSGAIAPVISAQGIIAAFHSGKVTSTASTVHASEQLPKRVLLVEDSMITRIQEKRILEAAGYEVVMAVDGQDGWSQLNQGHFDAVVSDILMPKMNGFELTKKIRSESRFADLPVILVTTLSSDDDRRRGLQSGANGYITKSGFEGGNLVATLDRLTGAEIGDE